jgi:hypothetical protein
MTHPENERTVSINLILTIMQLKYLDKVLDHKSLTFIEMQF